jgi:outer membrane lipoprotein carrier protein
MHCRLFLIAFALAGSTAWDAAARSDVAPTALAASVQRHYDQVRDFRADFTHTYVGGILRKKTVESGHVAIRKPGLMRWTYTEPEEKVFVSDGSRLYSYVPADKQVYVAAVPSGDQATTPALFLAGKGNLQRDFTVEAATVADAPPGSVAMKLTPVRPEREYDWLTLVVDGATLQLRMLTTSDAQGGVSTFNFTHLKENAGIPDKEFVFVMPHGVDVITDAGR